MNDQGGVILDGLLRTVGGLLVAALIIFELSAVAINHVRLDATAQEAARIAAQSVNAGHSEAAITTAVQEHIATLDGTLLRDVSVDDDTVAVALSRPAPVLLVDNLDFLAAHLVADRTAEAPTSR